MSAYAWPSSKASRSELRHDRDGALVRKRLRGSDEAFAVFYRRYHKRLVGYCVRRTECEALAEDLAHDTLIRALEHLDEFDTDRPAWPWLKAIAHNAIVDHVRKHGREDLLEQPVGEDDLFEDDLSDVIAERPVLAEALSELPDRQQVAVRLRYVESWRSAEAGAFLDLSRPAFEQLLFRARTNLRDNYERLCDDTSSRLAGLLLPVFQFKDTLTARIRARFAGWEQSLHAMGPAAMEAVGQAAATFAILGLAAAVAAGTSSSAPESPEIEALPAGTIFANLAHYETTAPSGETQPSAEPSAPVESLDTAPSATRHVDFKAPAPDQTGDVAAMGGQVGTTNSDERLTFDAVVRSRVGPHAPSVDVPVWIGCDKNATREAVCDAVRDDSTIGG